MITKIFCCRIHGCTCSLLLGGCVKIAVGLTSHDHIESKKQHTSKQYPTTTKQHRKIKHMESNLLGAQLGGDSIEKNQTNA